MSALHISHINWYKDQVFEQKPTGFFFLNSVMFMDQNNVYLKKIPARFEHTF